MKYSPDQIKNLVLKNKSVRISFTKDRHPMFGKLVMLADGEDLLKKGFIRFARSTELPLLEGTDPTQMYGENSHYIGSVSLTKMFVISDFEMVTEYEN